MAVTLARSSSNSSSSNKWLGCDMCIDPSAHHFVQSTAMAIQASPETPRLTHNQYAYTTSRTLARFEIAASYLDGHMLCSPPYTCTPPCATHPAMHAITRHHACAAVEETSNAMALDGIMFEGVSVRVRRPNDYNPAAAASLGPSTPNPNLNLAAIGLGGPKATGKREGWPPWGCGMSRGWDGVRCDGMAMASDTAPHGSPPSHSSTPRAPPTYHH